jgi:PBP1b-binding outer membrane lipoprotein LpoB
MKKVIAIISILFLLMGCTSVYATSQVNEVAQSTTGKIIEIKDKELKTLEEYKEAYGSDAYGLTAFLLSKIRVYSIPFGFVAIIIAAIYQYIIGIKKLDVRDKGFALMIASVTIVVICQVLPLVFAIVVKGWRG